MPSSITVYSKPACVACKATYRYLDKAGLDYDVVDVTRDTRGAELVAGLGYKEAPVVVADDDHWSGLRVEKIAALAAQQQ